MGVQRASTQIRRCTDVSLCMAGKVASLIRRPSKTFVLWCLGPALGRMATLFQHAINYSCHHIMVLQSWCSQMQSSERLNFQRWRCH